MKQKLRDNSGLTLIEMLCAVALLVLLVLILNTGLELSLRSYRDLTAEAETQLLLSTLADALADDLRYARDVAVDADGKVTFNSGAALGVNDRGQLTSGGKLVLPPGAYGDGGYADDGSKKGAYEVGEPGVSYDSGCFTIKLEVSQMGGGISAQAEFTVRCLNGK